MANEQNLRPIPFNQRSEEDCKRIGLLAAAAKKKKAAERKSAKERIKLALDIGKRYKLSQLNRMISQEKDPEKLTDLEFKRDMLRDSGLEIMQLFDIMSSKRTSPQSKLQAINSMLDRTDGKPIQQTQLTGAEGEPLIPPSITILPIVSNEKEK